MQAFLNADLTTTLLAVLLLVLVPCLASTPAIISHVDRLARRSKIQRQKAKALHVTDDSLCTPGTPGKYGVLLPDDSPPSTDGQRAAAMRSLAALYKTPEFKRHVQASGIDPRSVSRKLTLYEVRGVRLRCTPHPPVQSLRHMDPASFYQLTSAPVCYEQHPPARPLLALEYLTTCGIPAAAIVLHVSGATIPPPYALAWVIVHALCFAQGTSPVGRCLGMWYEHAVWCYTLPAWRVWAVVVLETAYCAASLGLGGLWSIAQRCCSPSRQGVAERLLCGRLVMERAAGSRRKGCC